MGKDKTTTKRIGMPVIFSLLIYIICFVTISIMLTAVVSLFFSHNDTVTMAHNFTLYIVMLVTVLATTYAVTKWVDRLPFSFIGLSIHHRMRDIWYGFLAAVAIYSIGFGSSCALGLIEVEGYSINWLSLFYSFLFFIVVSLGEEIMCRGYFLGRLLRTHINKFIALLISSLVFAILHIFNPNIGVLSFMNLWLAGCMLGVSYLYVRNLWYPISLHLFWNWIQGPILGYDVSGTSIYPSILKLSYPSLNVWNGGLFGFEGSLICTIIMIVYIVGVILYFDNNPDKITN